MNLHLSGGDGGIAAHFGKPLWGATEAIWRDLGTVAVDPALASNVTSGVQAELEPHNAAALLKNWDSVLTVFCS